jgi:hypothetical protein
VESAGRGASRQAAADEPTGAGDPGFGQSIRRLVRSP